MTPGLIAGTILPPLIVGAFALRYLVVLGKAESRSDADGQPVNQ